MVSFDIISIYLFIDVKELAKIINSKIENTYDKISNNLQSETNLASFKNCFTFNNQIYKHSNEVPTESVISNVCTE